MNCQVQFPDPGGGALATSMLMLTVRRLRPLGTKRMEGAYLREIERMMQHRDVVGVCHEKLLARRRVRTAGVGKELGVRGGCDSDAGAGNRSKQRALFSCQRGAAESAAVPES